MLLGIIFNMVNEAEKSNKLTLFDVPGVLAIAFVFKVVKIGQEFWRGLNKKEKIIVSVCFALQVAAIPVALFTKQAPEDDHKQNGVAEVKVEKKVIEKPTFRTPRFGLSDLRWKPPRERIQPKKQPVAPAKIKSRGTQ